MPPSGRGQITGCEDAEGLELAQPLGNIGREEQLADDHGEEDEDDEVVKLQRAAKGSQTQGFVILSIEGAGVIVLLCGRGHIRMFPIGFFSYCHPVQGAYTGDREYAACLLCVNRAIRNTVLHLFGAIRVPH